MSEFTLSTLAERPDLRPAVDALHRKVWPAFMQLGHNDAADRYWAWALEACPEYQHCLLAGRDELVAAAHSLPVAWGGAVEGLPGGWDDILARAFAGRRKRLEPDTLAGLSVAISPRMQGRGLGGRMIQAFQEAVSRRGFGGCLVPVRPTGKAEAVDEPMEEYLRRTRDDGLPADPWLRLHLRLGGEVLGVAQQSMTYTGTVREWERWTGLTFAESGDYVIPGGLDRLHIDREADRGLYVEANVWVRHGAG